MGKKKELEKIIRLIFTAKYVADDFRRDMKRIEDCKRNFDSSENEKQAGEDLTKNIVKNESDSSVFAAVLHRKKFVATSRRQMAGSSRRFS